MKRLAAVLLATTALLTAVAAPAPAATACIPTRPAGTC